MNISAPFIRRPAGTSLLAIGLFLAGIIAYHFMPVAPIPRVDYAMINVSASLPGADPQTVASSLAAPLERRLGQIAGVSEITSVSTLGGCSISIQFDLDRSVDRAARDVQAAINAATADLPINMPSPPRYRKINPADAPIMVLALTSETLSPTKIFEYADSIVAQKLSQVEGVSQAMVGGADKSAVRIQVNPAALASSGFSLEDVRSMIGAVNANSPKGSFESENLSYVITCNDQISEGKDYQKLIITQRRGTPVKLSAFGEARDSNENQRVAGWAGDKRAILIIIQKQAGANVIETVDRIRAVMPLLQKWIPPSIEISEVSNRTTTIRASVHDIQNSLLLSVGLVVMVIFLFLRRFWPTFIASITVPLTLSGACAVMYLCGFSVDNLSLMAITISVGFVVDDAIVVIENIHRHTEAGDTPMQAAFKGARQIGFTIVSMSISLVAVFIPLLFMGGLIGRLFHEFAVTVCLAILVSGVVSLTLTPMLCSRFLRADADYKKRQNAVQRGCENAFEWLRPRYESGLRWVLRHPTFMLCVAFSTLVGTAVFYSVTPKGFFPQQDTGNLSCTTDAAQDISFASMKVLQQRAAAIILADPAVQTLGSFIGSGGSSTVNNGSMFISLKPLAQRKVSADEVVNRLRRPLSQIPGLKVFLQPVQDIRVGGRRSKAQFQYALQSTDVEALNYWSATLVNKLRSDPRLTDVDSDQQTRGLQTMISVDRDIASRLGVSPTVIDNTLYDAFGQRQVSTLYKQYNQHHVILEAQTNLLTDPSALRHIYVKSSSGALVPLESLASFKATNTSLSVSHQGQFPAVTISFNLAPGVALGDATEIVEQTARELRMPSSVQGSFQGTAKVFRDSAANMPVLVAAALLAVYIVLGMLYESLVHPLTIISTLPSAGFGALLSLLVAGSELSLVSFIGIILLMGIVMKNAIIMIDFALDAERREGMAPRDAIFRACMIRFRPILMTSLAALLGAVPLAIGMGEGSELRQPLGVAVVGGLLISQIMTLFTTPVVYLAFESAAVRVRALAHRIFPRHSDASEKTSAPQTPAPEAAQ
jgi:hydrophobe/amphiphile efflux-1 (HAE1) family protein